MQYYFTKERVTEETQAMGETAKGEPLGRQVKACFSSRYWVIIMAVFLLYQFFNAMYNAGAVYYADWVLGSYNDGITMTLMSVVGYFPMGPGMFLILPLCKKFGKRNVTMWGFVLYALGSAICWMSPTNLYIVLVGQFIKNIGGLPCAYVFMALFSDGLDHLEWKTGIRCDGVANSLNGIITVAIGGVCTGIFNVLLAGAGYIAPPEGVVSGTAIAQPQAVLNVITFCFVGLEAITGLVMAGILIFLTIEKTISKKQDMIRERQKAACLANGEEWIEPEIRAAQEQAEFDAEAEEIFRKELKVKCEKKGWNYEEKLAEHIAQQEAAKEAAEKKRIAAEEKVAEKKKRAEERQSTRLAKMTPEQIAKKEAAKKCRQERDDAAWAIELEKGEAYYQKIQAELAAKQK